MCLFFCQAIAGCNYLLGLAYVGFCYYPSWILLFTGMVIPRASDLGSKLHCARYYADLVYYRRVFTVLGMYGLTLWYQEGTEQGNRKTFTCNIISNGQCTPAVLFWNGKGLCLKKKMARKCYFPQQNSNYQSFFIFVASAKYLQCFFSAEWFLLLFLGLQPTSPISGHKRFLLNRN